MQDFRNLAIWRRAHELTLQIYQVTAGFPTREVFGVTSQMRRSAASLATNIAEGCGRGSDADFARFLQISLGSASDWNTRYSSLRTSATSSHPPACPLPNRSRPSIRWRRPYFGKPGNRAAPLLL